MGGRWLVICQWLSVIASALLAAGCGGRHPAAVVVYTSVDEPYSRPVLDAFTRDTGTPVRVVFDTEASKSRGLAQRILAEQSRPRADVFWSSEVMQMLTLRQGGALAPYRPTTAADIPARYRDPESYWTGFAARFRVLVYNPKRIKAPPPSLLSLTDPRWRGEVTMANPLFGTTTTEAVALFQLLGRDRAREYFRRRKANATHLVDGNSVAAEETARGNTDLGQTDTDDAFIRAKGEHPLGISFPDQQGMGTLLILNTAGLVRGGPHSELGKRFLDYLVRPETELQLAHLPSHQLPLHRSLQHRLPPEVRELAHVRTMDVDYPRLVEHYGEVDAFLRETFLR